MRLNLDGTPRKKKVCPLAPKVCADCRIDFLGQYNRKRCDTCKAVKAAPRPRRFHNCVLCEKAISKRAHPNVKFCAKCRAEPRRAYALARRLVLNDNEKARQLTKYAVKVGFLPHPREFVCVDCKRVQAECYDHRDYSKPLEVDPVCCDCNSSRGKGVAVHFPCTEYVNQDRAA